MYPHHVFNLEPAGTFGMYPICYWPVSGRYFQPEPAMYSRCFYWFPGPLAPSATRQDVNTYGSTANATLTLRSKNNTVRITNSYSRTTDHSSPF